MTQVTNAFELLSVAEDRRAYRSGDDVVLGSRMWDRGSEYFVVPHDEVEVTPELLDELGAAVVLRKPDAE
jgi:hypothetical protein